MSELEKIRTRVAKTLAHGIQLNMSTDESKKLLKRHVNRKTNVVIMIVDVNNSTQMSLSLEEERFALLIQTFAQEISVACSMLWPVMGDMSSLSSLALHLIYH